MFFLPPHLRQRPTTDQQLKQHFNIRDIPPSVMSTQETTSLRFVTWNTCGIKDTVNFPQKFSDMLKIFIKHKADVAFIQETRIGPKDYHLLENVEGWKTYFTVYSPRSKGVAILIQHDVPFQYICHDEDHSGGYIVLFCHLYGELYTLVNVYNHKEDRDVLYTLKEYLQKTAEGVLVVGGDFNTNLDPNLDRSSSALHTGCSSLRSILEDFTSSLNLRDTWAHVHPTETGFTRCQGDSWSRLDMFFMPEDRMALVSSCDIERERISDHDPVVLTLRRNQQKWSVNTIPNVASMLKEFGHSGKPDRRPGMISGAEILRAIKSMTESGKERPYKKTVDYYKKHRCPMTEKLKIKYNTMLKINWIPDKFNKSNSKNISDKERVFNVEYLIFSLILAKRLKVFITPSFRSQKKAKLDLHLRVTFKKVPKKIKHYFLMKCLTSLKPIHPAPPRNFSILKSLLSIRRVPGVYLYLKQGCPLTNTILTLALNHLKNQISKTNVMISVCHFRHTLDIHAEESQCDTLLHLVRTFQEDSGIGLKISLDKVKEEVP